MKVLELYSGIGGMHLALKEANIDAEIVLAVDINPVANSVYKHNFPETNLLNRNIQSLSLNEINRLQIDMILMSPPCQPFTRNGKCLDADDNRSNSFLYLLTILNKIANLKYILMENVKGFENSKMRHLFIDTLTKAQFVYEEFLLTPVQFGVPNSRMRYYCLVQKRSNDSDYVLRTIKTDLPRMDYLTIESFEIKSILDCNKSDEFKIPEHDLIKHIGVIDVCYPDSRRSCCFTKAYGKYLNGTGSILCEINEDQVKHQLETIKNNQIDNANLIKTLPLRYFSPNEILKLMSFPDYFQFPPTVSVRQQYRLLGNSLNIKVVTNLINYLIKDER